MTIILRPLRLGGLLLTAVLLFGGSARAADLTAAPEEPVLVEVLRSGAPPEKAIACKQLAVYGSKDAVPELAKLLADEELASWARIALEAIPDAACDEALRQAARQLEGRLLVGVINSIGVRRDAKAVEQLAARLADQNTEVASAAAIALGHIGNDSATTSLRQALATSPPDVRASVAEGCILCAERLMAERKTSEAAEIYDEVRKADVPKQRVIEATRGAILARGSDGLPLLIEQFSASDKGLFQIGLSVARELPGRKVQTALAGELERAQPERAALILYALADRDDFEISPAVVKAAKTGDARLRVAAIDVIGRFGDSSVLDVLLEIATGPDNDFAQRAKSALAALPGNDLDGEIVERLRSAQRQAKAVLIELVGERRIDATDLLISMLDHPNSEIRTAALTALGETAGFDELPVLISQVLHPQSPKDAAVAGRALKSASVRMPDREATAARLAAALPSAPLPAKVVLLETLGAMGGPVALETVAAAAKSDEAELQDVATRLLGAWMSLEAAPVLLDLAKNAPSDKYKVRALRGYIRLARQFATSDAQRAQMCQNALDAATRPEEQKLVLDVLELYPSQETLAVAKRARQRLELRDEADRVALAIADKLGGDGAESN